MTNWKIATITSVVLSGCFACALLASVLTCIYWANSRYPQTCRVSYIILPICLVTFIAMSITFGVLNDKFPASNQVQGKAAPINSAPVNSVDAHTTSNTNQAITPLQVVPIQSGLPNISAQLPASDQSTLNARLAFLAGSFQLSHNIQAINIATVKYYNMPRCPMIFGYTASPEKNPSVCIKFSADFVNKLPSDLLQDLTSHYCLNVCDVFFVGQGNQGNPNQSIKVHAWVFDIPAAFTGALYNQNMLIGIYSASNSTILGEYSYQSLQSLNVNIHDNTLSPQHPTLAVPVGGAQPYYFWSLVIDSVAKRAAATLHWVMPFNTGLQDTATVKQPALTNSYLGSLAAGQTLDGFLQAIHSSAVFAAYPDMIAQLDNLFT